MDAYCRSVLRLQGNRIALRDFLVQDREPFIALEADEPMFTYMKFRIERASAESVQLPRLLQEPHLDPRPSYNLVVEDAEGFSGWAGIDRFQGTESAQLGWYLRSDRWGHGYSLRPPGSCSTLVSQHAWSRCGQLLTQKTWHRSACWRSPASPTED